MDLFLIKEDTMVDVEKEMMKEIMADYHSGDPRKVASAKEQILNKAQRLITFMIKETVRKSL